METAHRKTKIIKAVLETQDEEVLHLLEEDLNLLTNPDVLDIETTLDATDIEELKQGLAESSDKDSISEKEFWTLVDSWKKK